ncbi:ANTAR domain-containing protein [Streptomyces hygroscopicus]|uniref:ANTAR domain-containing protein n=1 Tax=Streptomyces hygroscopicus TaxID=1912 RepID=UPI0036339332
MPGRTHSRPTCQIDAPTLGRGLAELAEQAAAGTPDSCGATATAVLAQDPLREAAEDPTTAATHPDLSALVSVQLNSGEGPILAALDTGRPAGADDLLHDDRWPCYRARALDAGVRSTATLPFACDGLTVTVSVYGLRPGPLEKAAQGVTGLLGDLATESMARDRLYRAALAQVGQLDEALRSRPVVDQACGIVMYVLGCDPDQAFDLLRRLSQRSNRKLTELAETVVRTRGRGLEKNLIAFGRSAARGPGRPASAPDRDLPE